MKISYSGYALTQLLGGETQKTVRNRIKDVSADAADAVTNSAVDQKAVVRHLNSIEDITSEIMSIVDRGVAVSGTAASGNGGVLPAETLRFRPVMPGDVLIVVPDRGSPGFDAGTARGSVTIVRNIPSAEAVDEAGMPEDGAISGLMTDIAQWPTLLGAGIRRSPEANPAEPTGRFVISVKDGPGPSPLLSVRCQNTWGKTETLEEKALSGQTTLASVIRTLVQGSAEATSMVSSDRSACGASQMPAGFSEPQPIAQETPPGDRPESPLPSFPGFDYLGKARKVFSRILPGMTRTPVVGQADEKEASDPSPAGAPENPISLAAKLPGFAVTVLDARTGHIVSPDARDPVELVAEKMVRLSGAVDGLVSLQGGNPETDPDKKPQTLIKEALKRTVRDSFYAAIGRLNGGAVTSGPGAFGIALDEKGGIKIDSMILKDALGASREEAVSFVRSLASSLHDRIGYEFNPFAGVYGGVHEKASLCGPRNNESVASEEQNAKADFEKRLNELQMLLKSCRELKDSFVQRKLAGQERLK